MSYDIVKGWPAPGALDINLVPASGNVFVGGEVALIDSTTGEAVIATFAADGSNSGDMAVFVIGVDTLNGGISALKSGMVIEVDADGYTANSYAPNDVLTATAGKFSKVVNSEKAVGKVLSYNSQTGVMRIIWTAVD